MTNDTTSSVGSYVRANRTFFLFVVLLLITVTGYFWWRNGFSLDFSRFFAAPQCGDNVCEDGSGEDQNSCPADCGSSGPGCGPVPAAQQTCNDGDCDDDGALNPSVYNGNDCDDSTTCLKGQSQCRQQFCGDNTCDLDNESMASCPRDCFATCGPPAQQTCNDGDCDDDGALNPSVYNGDDCDDNTTCLGGQRQCRQHYCGDNTCDLDHESQSSCAADCAAFCGPVPAAQQTCNDGDCDDDGAFNPSVYNGNDCDDNTTCLTGKPQCRQHYCGDNTCDSGNEDQTNCPGDCSVAACIPTFRSCNGNTIFQHYKNCNGRDTETCKYGCNPGDGTNAFCEAAPTATATATAIPPSANAGTIDRPVSADRATGTITNNSGTTKTMHLSSWCATEYPTVTTASQVFHDATFVTVNPGQSVTLSVAGCGCYTQYDLSGSPTVPSNPSLYGNTGQPGLLDYAFAQNVPLCGATTPVSTTHLACSGNACVSVSGAGANTCASNADCQAPATSSPPVAGLRCVATIANAAIGQAVPFTASGGTGSYTWYAPSGVPGTGSGSSFSSAYSVPGFKTVTVVSGPTQANCTVTIRGPTVTVTPPPLVCAPASQTVVSGQPATMSATGGSPGYWWSAPNGNPALRQAVSSASFTTVFTNTTQPSRIFPVTVIDTFDRTAVCNVNVTCPVASCAAAPAGCSYQGGNACTCGTLVCPSGSPLACAPSSQTVEIGQAANFQAAGGTGSTFTWSAPGGSPTSATGSGRTFATTYGSGGGRTVTVTSGGLQATCNVLVQQSTTPALSIEKTARNVTANGPTQETVSANPGDTVEFILRVSSVGTGTATHVIVADGPPDGLIFQPGTTTIDGTPSADITPNSDASALVLGNMAPGRTITVRFRATVASASFFSAGTTSLTNTGFARGDNTAAVRDTAFVTVVRTSANPTLSLVKLGRNVTRGETGERTSVNASPGQTVEFILRVRNTTASGLTGVVVRDVLPQGITYVPGTTRVNGLQPFSETLLTSGVNIGSLAPNQEAVVTFSGRVADAADLPAGTTTRINTAYVSADGVPQISAQLPVIITRTGPPVTEIPTGPADSTVLALIISAVITLLYVGYTSTDVYRRREVEGLAGQADQDRDLLDFKR